MDRGRDAAREGSGAIAGSLELLKLVIEITTNLKKIMGRERRRWQTHQNEEERLNSTRKPRRRATAIPRVSNLLRSVSCDLARNLDGKRDEGTRGYPFITPNMTIKDRNPGFLDGFGCGGVRLRLGHDERKKGRG
jgi:hypothetical protein